MFHTSFNDLAGCVNFDPSSVSDEILNSYNCNRLCIPEFNVADVDYEPTIEIPCNYFSVDCLSAGDHLSSSFSIMGLNLCSIRARFDDIKLFLFRLQEKNIYFDAIIFQETWLNDSDDLCQFQLEGYRLINRGK